MFMMRFDMRSPQPGSDTADLYAAAIDMCAWAETRGCGAVVLCEHHGSADGYLPAPLILAAAIAARTTRVGITVAAIVLPFYDPVRLAEDMNVLDIVSRGRVSYVLALGYRPEEYEQFGVDMSRRGQIADEKLRLLLELRAGGPVSHGGRTIQVTPGPVTPGGPPILWGGGSPAAARRAGRHGLGFLAQRTVDGLREIYDAESKAAGHEPGLAFLPDPDTPFAIFVADDVDAAWEELGPHLLHDARMYATWNPGDESTVGITPAQTVAELRSSPGYRIVTPDEARTLIDSGQLLPLAPLCGGIPPATAWPYLERAAALLTSPGTHEHSAPSGLQ